MVAKRQKPLKLDVRQVGSAAVVCVSGSAGITEAERLRLRLEKLAEKKMPLIILDLSEMNFICSAGLGAIISAHLKCRHHDGKIRLVSPEPAIMELLATTRLTKLFDIYDSVEQAAQSD